MDPSNQTYTVQVKKHKILNDFSSTTQAVAQSRSSCIQHWHGQYQEGIRRQPVPLNCQWVHGLDEAWNMRRHGMFSTGQIDNVTIRQSVFRNFKSSSLDGPMLLDAWLSATRSSNQGIVAPKFVMYSHGTTVIVFTSSFEASCFMFCQFRSQYGSLYPGGDRRTCWWTSDSFEISSFDRWIAQKNCSRSQNASWSLRHCHWVRFLL